MKNCPHLPKVKYLSLGKVVSELTSDEEDGHERLPDGLVEGGRGEEGDLPWQCAADDAREQLPVEVDEGRDEGPPPLAAARVVHLLDAPLAEGLVGVEEYPDGGGKTRMSITA